MTLRYIVFVLFMLFIGTIKICYCQSITKQATIIDSQKVVKIYSGNIKAYNTLLGVCSGVFLLSSLNILHNNALGKSSPFASMLILGSTAGNIFALINKAICKDKIREYTPSNMPKKKRKRNY